MGLRLCPSPVPPPQVGSVAAQGRHLFSGVELDPVEERFILDRPCVGCPRPEGFEVCFASEEYVGAVDGGEGDLFDRVNLDLTVAHPIATARSHLWALPQPEGQRDVTRQDASAQFPAELHGLTLRRCRLPGPSMSRAAQV